MRAGVGRGEAEGKAECYGWVQWGLWDLLLGTMLEAGPGHAFAEPAVLDEILFEATNLLIQEVVCLMNQAERDVGDDFGWPRLDE